MEKGESRGTAVLRNGQWWAVTTRRAMSERRVQAGRCARTSGLQRSSTMRGLARFSTKPVRTVALPVGLSFPVQIAFERAMRRRTVVDEPTAEAG